MMKNLTLLLHVLVFTATAAAAPCSSPEYAQFDFWIGRWQVHNARTNRVQGTNVVTKIGNCAITEEWSGGDGLVGRSVTGFDAARRVWHQTWIDSAGSVLVTEGGLRDGTMQLKSARDRQTWTVLPDGTVRQLWERSPDGKKWVVALDLRYTRIRR